MPHVMITQHVQEAESLQVVMTDSSFPPRPSIQIEKRQPFTGNLNSEMPGDSQSAFPQKWFGQVHLHCTDVIKSGPDLYQQWHGLSVRRCCMLPQ